MNGVRRGGRIGRWSKSLAPRSRINAARLLPTARAGVYLRHVRFRSFKRLRTREGILADVGRWLWDFNELEEVLADRRPFTLADLERCLPFALLGLDSDNGGEFLNYHVLAWLQKRPRPIYSPVNGIGHTRSSKK